MASALTKYNARADEREARVFEVAKSMFADRSVAATSYIDSARRLNEVDERRPYRIETAAKIAAGIAFYGSAIAD